MRPETVVVIPVPGTVSPPGNRVSVHVPVAGSPVSTAPPVDRIHVGWTIVSTTGGEGVPVNPMIVNSGEGNEVQPVELVTVNL